MIRILLAVITFTTVMEMTIHTSMHMKGITLVAYRIIGFLLADMLSKIVFCSLRRKK